jgi:hypothetical protein
MNTTTTHKNHAVAATVIAALSLLAGTHRSAAQTNAPAPALPLATNSLSNPVSQLVYNVALALGTNAPALGSESFDFNLLTMSRGLSGVENMMEFNWNFARPATNTQVFAGADIEDGAVPGTIDEIDATSGSGRRWPRA